MLGRMSKVGGILHLNTAKITINYLTPRVIHNRQSKCIIGMREFHLPSPIPRSPSAAHTHRPRPLFHSLNPLHIYWSKQPNVFWRATSPLFKINKQSWYLNVSSIQTLTFCYATRVFPVAILKWKEGRGTAASHHRAGDDSRVLYHHIWYRCRVSVCHRPSGDILVVGHGRTANLCCQVGFYLSSCIYSTSRNV